MAIQEKVMIKRVPEAVGFGWTVSVIRAVGPQKGTEHCLAMLCGGNVGKVLAALCGRQIAEMMMIDTVEVDTDLATTGE